MADAAGSSRQHQRSHVPTFSAQHPIIPRLYVMPWRQDMKNRRLLMKNAGLAGVPAPPHEESLWLCGRERLCHRQDSSCCTAPLSQAGLLAPASSHFSRYNSSTVTFRQLYHPEDTSHT